MIEKVDLESLEEMAKGASYDGFSVKVFVLEGDEIIYPIRVGINEDNYDFRNCCDTINFIAGLSVIKPVKRMSESAMIQEAYSDGVRTVAELAQWKNKKGLI